MGEARCAVGAPQSMKGDCGKEMCTSDEGRSFGIALQWGVPNHHVRLGSKALVVSNVERLSKRQQVPVWKVNESEPLMNASRIKNDVETGGAGLPRDKPAGRLLTAQAASSVKAARATLRRVYATTGTIEEDVKCNGSRRDNAKAQRHEASRWDGLGCKSEEGW